MAVPLWNHQQGYLSSPSRDISIAALGIGNAFNSLDSALGDIKKNYIEDPATKQYLHDLNNGKDISNFDIRNVNTDVLKDTGMLRGIQIQNTTNQDKLNDTKRLRDLQLSNSEAFNDLTNAINSGNPELRAKALATLRSLDPSLVKQYDGNAYQVLDTHLNSEAQRAMIRTQMSEIGQRLATIKDTQTAYKLLVQNQDNPYFLAAAIQSQTPAVMAALLQLRPDLLRTGRTMSGSSLKSVAPEVVGQKSGQDAIDKVVGTF